MYLCATKTSSLLETNCHRSHIIHLYSISICEIFLCKCGNVRYLVTKSIKKCYLSQLNFLHDRFERIMTKFLRKKHLLSVKTSIIRQYFVNIYIKYTCIYTYI